MRVSRYALLTLLLAVSLGASAVWLTAANAQETSKPEEASRPPSAADSKSAPGRVPKDILLVNPCKAAHPPSYCNARN